MSATGRYREINRVYTVSFGTNLVMLVLKLGVGLFTGSLAMVADAVDSSLDAVANLMAMVMTRIAGRPPDDDHPYGHRRFETLGAMLIGGLLLLTAWEIVQNSIDRLLSGEAPDVGPANFVVMGIAFLVNLVLFFYQRRAGERLRSEVLHASAEDKRSDIMVSCTVFLSLVAVQMGTSWIDAVAALVVVVLIGRTALGVVRKAAGVLVDRAALDPRAVREVAVHTPGVEQIARVRSRGPVDDIHLDMDVHVAAPTTTGQCAAIASELRGRLQDHFAGLTDIQVNFSPVCSAPLDYPLVARAEADALGLGVHEVAATRTGEGLVLEMHVEVPSGQTIGQAHEVVSEFENRLHSAIPDTARIVTHIEPAHPVEEALVDTQAHELARRALGCAEQLFPDNCWHDCRICSAGARGYALSMHCHVDPDMPLDTAHQLAEQVETRVRTELPKLSRVTIHTEPPGAN